MNGTCLKLSDNEKTGEAERVNGTCLKLSEYQYKRGCSRMNCCNSTID